MLYSGKVGSVSRAREIFERSGRSPRFRRPLKVDGKMRIEPDPLQVKPLSEE
jgi:hypothetical protein